MNKWIEGKAYVTMSKVIMGKGGFYNCLIEHQGVSAWWKEREQARVFVLSPSWLLNHLKPQSSKALCLLPIIPMGTVAYAFTILWDNLYRNSCIQNNYSIKTLFESSYTLGNSYLHD